MKTNIKTLQISIISFAFLLIIVTYFYIPKIEERKLKEKALQKNEIIEDSNESIENNIRVFIIFF